MDTLLCHPDIDCHLLYYLDLISIGNLASISKSEYNLISNLDFIKEIAIIKKNKITEWNIIYYATINGYLSILKWSDNIISNLFFNENDTDETIHDKLKKLNTNQKITETIPNHSQIIRHYTNILQWVFYCGSNFEHVNIDIALASKTGNLTILKLLFKFNYRPKLESYRICDIINAVAQTGDIFILDWLSYSNYKIIYTGVAIDDAAENGNLDVIKWFDKSKYEFNYKYAIDNAAKNGYLDIIKWFDNSRHQFKYTGHTTNNAVLYGHYDIILWFLESKHDFKCLVDAIDSAWKMGRIDMLKLLKSKDKILYDDRMIRYAAENGHLHVLKWFYKSLINDNVGQKTDLTFVSGFHELSVVSVFHKQAVYNAASGAINNGYMHVVEWLKAICDIEISELLTRQYILQWLYLASGSKGIDMVALQTMFPSAEIINCNMRITIKIPIFEYSKNNIIQYDDILEMNITQILFCIKNGEYIYFSLR